MNTFTEDEKKLLLKAVDDSIEYGIKHQKLMPVNLDDYPIKLKELGASFITLEINGALRGCIGSLQAHQPLITDIVHNAFAAAFQDPRFPPLKSDETSKLTKHISILSAPKPIEFTSEEDLIAKLRPNVDGLILQEKGMCGTFLPAVWEKIPEPKAFLQHLKMKAGLLPTYWSNTIKVFRYETEVIE